MAIRRWLALAALGSATLAWGQQPGQLARVSLGRPESTLVDNHSPAIAGVVDTRHDRLMNRLWIASAVTMFAATATDAGTSWSYHEGNGLLASKNGSFGSKGVAIKMGGAAALLLPEILLRHHKDLRSMFIAGNLVDAGIYTATSIHNVRLINSGN